MSKPLPVGSQAPDFELEDQRGQRIRLSALLRSGPVVLFFYPAANTRGCTAEACHFRDLGAEFTALGAQRLGLSGDDVAKQKDFSDRHKFDYPVLSDAGHAVAEQYGVKGGLLGLSPVKRATFVIDQGGIIRKVIASEINMNTHADQALSELRALAAPRAS